MIIEAKSPLAAGRHTKLLVRVFVLLCLALVFSSYTGPLFAQEIRSDPSAGEKFSDQRVKAAFLFNFMKFITLPVSNGALPRQSIGICIYGDGDTDVYHRMLEGKTVGSKSLIPMQRRAGEKLDNCEVIFFQDPEPVDSGLLERIKNRGILTVGDSPQFFSQGGIIHFVIKENKIRFEISNRRAEAEGIRISADLLKLALFVEQ